MDSSSKIGVLFIDLSGHARLASRIGETEAMRAVDRCTTRIHRAIQSAHGTLVGDSTRDLIAVFSTADQAVSAAIEMQERVADLPPVSGIKLTLRIGCYYGTGTIEAEGICGDAMEIGGQLLGMAGINQILSCAQTQSFVTGGNTTRFQPLSGVALTLQEERECPVFEILWNGQAGITPIVADTRLKDPAVRTMVFRFQGRSYVLDEKTPVLTIGRDSHSVIQINDKKISRHHARIEYQPEGYLLVDLSTNGTYLAVDGQEERVLRHREELLHGRGRIGFGHPVETRDRLPSLEFAET